MRLRRTLLEDRQIRHRKPVASTSIGLDHMVHSCLSQRFFEAQFLLLRKTRVFDRPEDVEIIRLNLRQ